MDTIMKNNSEIKVVIANKLDYLLQTNDNIIPDEYNLGNWDLFMPLIKPTTIKSIKYIAANFKDTLMKLFISGDKEQFDKYNMLRSKMIYYALHIQMDIQKVVSKNTALLMNNVKEPFLENSCCDDSNINTYKYFIDNEKSIDTYNNHIIELSNIMHDIHTLTKATILFSPEDTKYSYPNIPSTYSEKIIFNTIIKYCKFDSHMSISEEMRAICGEKPSYILTTNSIEENIELMMEQEKHKIGEYNGIFNDLLLFINQKNIININNTVKEDNVNIKQLISVIDYLDSKDSNIIPEICRNDLLKLLTLDEIYNTDNNIEPEKNKLKNYLSRANELMFENIKQVFGSTLNKKENELVINHLLEIVEDIDDNIGSKHEFMKNLISNLIKIYPNIILHKLDFSSIQKFKHWKLSPVHWNDIIEIVNKYYKRLIQFYDDEDIKIAINNINQELDDIIQFYSLFEIMISTKDKSSIFDIDLFNLLNKYLIYTIISEYISIGNNSTLFLNFDDKSIPPIDSLSSISMMEDIDENVDIDMVAGKQEEVLEKICNLLQVFINMSYESYVHINYNYEKLKDKLLRSKEKEKEIMTDKLKDMTDEERQVENIFKTHKLEQWSIGLQKGFREYDAMTYDMERENLEKQMINDIKAKKDLTNLGMNQEIYNMEAEILQAEIDMIEAEEFGLEHLGEDDDFGEFDGDEYY